MNQPFFTRWSMTAAVLALVAATGAPMPAHALDANGAQWRQQSAESRPAARHENGFVAVGGKLYLIGGRGDRPLDIHDPQTGKWSKGEQPPFEIHHFQAVDYDGKLYVIGALTGKFPEESPVPDILIYDPVADRWSKGPEVPLN